MQLPRTTILAISKSRSTFAEQRREKAEKVPLNHLHVS
jgi:hypothetical protein